MATTYSPIATTTLGSAASSITFSSIPSTYTDLKLILTFTINTGDVPSIKFNSDSGTNYSFTLIRGASNSTVGSSRVTNSSSIFPGYINNNGTIPSLAIYDIFSYAGSTYKTALISYNSDINSASGGYGVENDVALWRSTSAINRIDITALSGNNYLTGTTATLYGIKAA